MLDSKNYFLASYLITSVPELSGLNPMKDKDFLQKDGVGE